MKILNKKLTTLNESEELKESQKLQEQEENLSKDQKRLDYEIHSYFSRLQKPFRKYERLSPHNKTLKLYLEDSTIAFKKDKDLNILLILNALKTNINIFNFDERQETNFLEMIEDGNAAYFKILHNREQSLLEKKQQLDETMKEITVINNIKSVNDDIHKLEVDLESSNEASGKLESKSNQLNTDVIKNDIVARSKELLNVELTISC